MFGSDILEVAIGLILLFLLVSLIATAIQELIEAKLKLRGADLERGLKEMFNEGLCLQCLYEHPLVYSLYIGPYRPSDKSNLPHYIPSSIFAGALLDLVVKGGFPGQDQDEVKAVGEAARTNEISAISNPSVPQPGAPTLGALKPDQVQGRLRIAELRATAEKIPSPELKKAIVALLDEADNDISKFRSSIENWFNGTMDRVSGAYKRRTQYIIFVIGLLLAVTLNIDAVAIAIRLSNDKALRQAAVGQVGAMFNGTGAINDPDKLSTVLTDLQKKSYAEMQQKIESIGYPVGWTLSDAKLPVPTTQGCKWDNGTCKSQMWFGTWFAASLGWLITAFAVMLGAPFWFDILNKFMVIRSTVKPREKSQEEGSEDRPQK